MSTPPKKGEAILLLGDGPKEEEAEGDASPDYDALLTNAARDVLKAIKADDVEALKVALSAVSHACMAKDEAEDAKAADAKAASMQASDDEEC